MIGTGKVRSAHPLPEESVSAEDNPLIAQQEGYPSWRVARGVQHHSFQFADDQGVSIVQESVGNQVAGHVRVKEAKKRRRIHEQG
jgi:uncharacterized membrane-anchored protein